uniref:Uncharacterized protein LOC114335339 isoform X2 n=1 Tax=Diabrotica virgifera virgifera TaxID=50390 RepID=A0A6P7FY14_DIAVI
MKYIFVSILLLFTLVKGFAYRPRFDDRSDPRFDDRSEPRFDDRYGPRFDERYVPRFDDRYGPRFDDRFQPRFDDRYYDRYSENHRDVDDPITRLYFFPELDVLFGIFKQNSILPWKSSPSRKGLFNPSKFNNIYLRSKRAAFNYPTFNNNPNALPGPHGLYVKPRQCTNCTIPF